MSRPKLIRFSVSNYKGISSPQSLETEQKGNLVLVGPNNSGKTLILSAIADVADWARVLPEITGGFSAPLHEFQMQIGQNTISIQEDKFNRKTDAPIEIACTYNTPATRDGIGSFLEMFGFQNFDSTMPLTVRLNITRQGMLFINEIDVAHVKIKREHDGRATIKGSNYSLTNPGDQTNRRFSELSKSIKTALTGVVYVPSQRRFLSLPEQPQTNVFDGAKVLDQILYSINSDSSNIENVRETERYDDFLRWLRDFFSDSNVRIFVSNNPKKLSIQFNDKSLPIERLGEGISELLLATFAFKLGYPTFRSAHTYIFEEPELHLHPAMQRQLMRVFSEDLEKNVIVSTHSSAVVDEGVRSGWPIFSTRVALDGSVMIRKLHAKQDVVFAMLEMGVRPSEVLMYDKIIWVEGPTDVSTVEAWISIYSKRIVGTVGVIGAAGGDNWAAAEFDVDKIKAISPDSIVLFDSERSAAGGDPSPSRKAILAKCSAIGLAIHLTELNSLESYFTEKALKHAYPAFAGPVEKYKPTKRWGIGYNKHNNGIVARQMVWADLEKTDVGKAITRFLSAPLS